MDNCFRHKWNVSTKLIIIVWTLLSLASISNAEHIEKMIEASKNLRVPNLKCHVCHSETDARCFNFTTDDDDFEFEGFSQNCSSLQMTCMVKKFAFTLTDGNGTTSPMKTFSVKRNCTRKCEDGCVVMGERTRLYVCSHCCTTPNCNVGSGATLLKGLGLGIYSIYSLTHLSLSS